jgi:hypothetical protein
LKLLWAALFVLVPLAGQAEPRVITEKSESAQPVAVAILQHLAAGRIEEAARLSNEPKRREEVLRDYMASVGEDEFKRVYAEYLSHPIAQEIALGPRRLVMWQLGERLAGQYYVQSGDTFVMDDRPSEERSALRRVLENYRRK